MKTLICESRIDGEYNGWEDEVSYKLINGQVWKQKNYHYHYHYAYCPSVKIYNTESGYVMEVSGDSVSIPVRRIG